MCHNSSHFSRLRIAKATLNETKNNFYISALLSTQNPFPFCFIIDVGQNSLYHHHHQQQQQQQQQEHIHRTLPVFIVSYGQHLIYRNLLELQSRVHLQRLRVYPIGFDDTVHGVSIMVGITARVCDVDTVIIATMARTTRDVLPVNIPYVVNC